LKVNICDEFEEAVKTVDRTKQYLSIVMKDELRLLNSPIVGEMFKVFQLVDCLSVAKEM